METSVVSAFRAPPFCNHDPSMWFSLVECSFKASTVTKSLTKFLHCTSLIPADVLTQVSDIVSVAAESDSPYEELKTAILSRLQSSKTARFQELLSKEELGNEKPTDLLRRMKKLLGNGYQTFDNSLFHHLFYQRLPSTIQKNLFSVKSKLSLEELAELADEFMATVPTEHNISTMNSTTEVDELKNLVSKLTLQINYLESQLSQRPRRRRSTSRRRIRSKSPHDICFYHKRFGVNARKCTKPCSFTSRPKANGEH